MKNQRKEDLTSGTCWGKISHFPWEVRASGKAGPKHLGALEAVELARVKVLHPLSHQLQCKDVFTNELSLEKAESRATRGKDLQAGLTKGR